MRFMTILVLILLAVAAPAVSVSPSWALGLELGGGVIGGGIGVAIAVTAIGEITPRLESAGASTLFVFTSVALCGGVGAGIGVLAAARSLGHVGNPGRCLIGGIVGGLASLLTEPLLSLLRVPEEITEFAGMLLLPILPAIGATIGFR